MILNEYNLYELIKKRFFIIKKLLCKKKLEF